MGGTPNITALIGEVLGFEDDGYLNDYLPLISLASNIMVGTNPPYSATDFFSLYPKFGGTPLQPTGTVDGTTATITGVSSIAGLLAGQLVSGIGIADGSQIVSASGSTVVLSLPTTQAGSPVQLNVYAAPLIPMVVLNSYIYLASASIFQVRYCEMWQMVMGLYIAHFATLWLQGEASSPNTTAAQAAASGLALGIKTSKSAGDVSLGIQAVAIDGFGSWNLTLYGQQFATIAKAIGSGGMLLY